MPTDKLIALSGLTNNMKRALIEICPDSPHRYFAGLWEGHLRLGLCWYTVNSRSRTLEYRAPSWSWASLDGAVAQTGQLGDFEMFYIVETFACVASTEYLGDSSIGQVVNGKLDLTGPWLKIRLDGPLTQGYDNQRTLDALSNLKTQRMVDLPALDDPAAQHKVFLDTDEDFPKRVFVFFF
jgi:hypothetical protein